MFFKAVLKLGFIFADKKRELIKERLVRERPHPFDLDQPLISLMRILDVQEPYFPDASLAEKRHVDRRLKRAKRLIRADIGGRLLSANMLLACLKRQYERPSAIFIRGHTRDPSRDLSKQRVFHGKKSKM